MTFVPYRGVAPAMQDLLAGQIDLLFSGPEQLPLIRAGSAKAYAVSSDVRLQDSRTNRRARDGEPIWGLERAARYAQASRTPFF